MDIELSVKLAIQASGLFLFVGMLTGVWKYWEIRNSEKHRAHYYVDVAHRTSLLYASACLILAVLAYFSAWSAQVNLWLVLGNIVFFAVSVLSYIIHGVLKDTTNQFQVPHKVSRFHLPQPLMTLFMVALIVVELSCTLLLVVGVYKLFF